MCLCLSLFLSLCVCVSANKCIWLLRVISYILFGNIFDKKRRRFVATGLKWTIYVFNVWLHLFVCLHFVLRLHICVLIARASIVLIPTHTHTRTSLLCSAKNKPKEPTKTRMISVHVNWVLNLGILLHIIVNSMVLILWNRQEWHATNFSNCAPACVALYVVVV